MLVLIYKAWSICKDGGGYVRAKYWYDIMPPFPEKFGSAQI